MRKAFGEIGDNRLTVMAAISFLDEREDVKLRVAELEAALAAAKAHIEALISEKFRTQSTAHWVEQLQAARIPCGPVNNFAQVYRSLPTTRRISHLSFTSAMCSPTITRVFSMFSTSFTPSSTLTVT